MDHLIDLAPWVLASVGDALVALQHVAAAALLLLAVGLLLRGRPLAASAGALAAAALALALGPVWSPPAPPRAAPAEARTLELTIVAANLRRDNPRLAEAGAALLAADPDLLMLLETPEGFLEANAEALARRGLVHVERAWPEWRRLALVSRRPLARQPEIPFDDWRPPGHLTADLPLAPGMPPLRITAIHFAGPFSLVHLWQRYEVARMAPLRAAPMLVAGDLNAPLWGATPAALARAMDLKLTGGWRPSWLPRLGPLAPLMDVLRPWVGLPIDHALVSEGLEIVSIRMLRVPGSDHLAQAIRLRVSAPSTPHPPSARIR